MIKKFLLAGFYFVIVSSSLIAYSQKIDFNNYTMLKCEGKIPRDFLSSFSEKYESGLAVVADSGKRSLRKTKDEFVQESNFYLNELLLSGKVLFGDPVTEYVNKVADKLLVNFPELRPKISFYTTKSPFVNAFSTDQGIIFVNVGLIAQLENEAQLAYILAHEIVHFVKKHNMDLFVFSECKLKKSAVKKSKYEDKMLSTSFRSKESEFESDREGYLTFFKQSGYSIQAVKSAFDVMLYSFLPFDEEEFKKSFFETPFLKFPQSYLLDSVLAVNATTYLSEESETHPSIEKRRETMYEFVSTQSNSASGDFLVSNEEFLYVRNICRFESVRLKVLSGDYIDALYDCFLLSKEFPENRFLSVSASTCLYGLSRYKNEWKTIVNTSYKKIQGEQQQIYFFIQKLNRKELNVLALNYCWHTRLKYPDSDFLKLITDDLMVDLVVVNKVPFNFFMQEYPKSDSAKNTDTANHSKYEKIKMKQKKDGVEDEYIRFAFIDLMKDTSFYNRFLYYDKIRQKENVEEVEIELSRKEYKKYLKEKNKPCTENCIESIVIANPFYLQYNVRKDEKVKFFSTETLKQDFILKMEENAKKANLNMSMLAPDKLNENETDKWNDIAFINEWFEERMYQSDIELVPFENEIMQSTMMRYNASHLFWNGVISVRIPFNQFNNLSACCLPYTLPIDIYHIFKPFYQIFLFQMLYDTRNGKKIESNMYSPNTRYFPNRLDVKLYRSFQKIKRMKKTQ